MPLSQAQHSALSVTAAPCHLSQRERQERFATTRAFCDYKSVLRLWDRLLGSPFGGAVWPMARLRGRFILNDIAPEAPQPPNVPVEGTPEDPETPGAPEPPVTPAPPDEANT